MNDVLLDPYHAANDDECLAPEEAQNKRFRKPVNPRVTPPLNTFLEK